METRSLELFAEARKLIPGGVNSPVRACSSVDSTPLFIAAGKGSRIRSADGEEYIDFVQSWGPLLLGHAHPKVLAALREALENGTSFGAPCEAELRLAQAICAAVPSIEMVRMVSSGTEAAMSALRLARGCTGRKKLLKFDGGYHGHADAFLARAGSGVATLSIPGTPGVPEAVVSDTLIAPYNDSQAAEDLFRLHRDEIAAVFVEPAAGNMGLVLPRPGFLESLRALCDRYGALLVFDEVITGFRVAYHGAQGHYRIKPDLTVLGKIIGGGMPVGAYGGKRDLMLQVAPAGPVYQAGTLSGNPAAMAAGLATLRVLRGLDYAALSAAVEDFCRELEGIFAAKGIPARINRLASMFTVFFSEREVTDFASAKNADQTRYTKFYKHLRARGVYIAPSAFETAMVSFAHGREDFRQTLEAADTLEF
ncbi:MAG: glutamate-1-semialdehyde 2,1-aminomutase [Deltaproteobacteria bacterium]|jgi:glutamate-1-semialdehyde 2,1-aminomutase|nr:glutamate-1-semialdehyde 2,1-aminomutase [Deltaproteobacteria bacterium]